MELYTFNEEYVQRLTDGDPETEAHFTSYFGDLLSIKLRARLRSAQGVEDAIQETFLRVLTALRGRHTLEQPERLGAFVNSVCNNVLYEHYRTLSRSAQLPDGFDPPLAGASIESRLVTDERKALVREALGELPVRDRQLIRKLFLDEQDKDEICAEYGVDREYLRVLVHRGVDRLRKLVRTRLGAGKLPRKVKRNA